MNFIERMTDMIIPDNEILYQLFLYIEGFDSFKILADKMNKFLISLKTVFISIKDPILLSDAVNLIKRAKGSIKKHAHIAELDSQKRIFYNDKEFNQEYDIKKEEAKALANEIRTFCLKKYEIHKIQIEKSYKNPNELFESLFEKYFPLLNKNDCVEERLSFHK